MKTLSALANNDFRRYWWAQSVSLVGGTVQNSALAWLVLNFSKNQTKAAVDLGLILALQFAPSLLLSVFAGVLIDRISRKKILLISQSSLTIIAISLTILTFLKITNETNIAIISLLIGIATAFDFTARQSMIANLVEREYLTSAIALNSLSFHLTRVIGAGVFALLAPLGMPWLFLINTLSFAGILVVVAGLPLKSTNAQHASIIKEIKLGFAYVNKVIELRYLIVFLGLMSLTVINFQTIIPIFAKNALDLREEGFGFLQIGFSFGAIVAALWQSRYLKINKKTILCFGAGLILIGLTILSFSMGRNLAFIALIICGVGNIMFNTNANSLIQLSTPNIMRGRVLSIYNMIFNGMTPFGTILVGSILMAHLGAKFGLLVTVLLALLSIIWLAPKILHSRKLKEGK